jgi:hypothetical protein
VSPLVHALPSLQAVPFGSAGGDGQVPATGSHVTALWHASGAGHDTGFEPVHMPPWHASVCVQPLPSLHAVPLALVVAEQTPVAGLHVGTLWHASGAGPQSIDCPTQAPAWQTSPVVHALPSEHVTPVMVVHTPSVMAPAETEQASHTPPLHALSQQRPSTQ